MNNYYCRMTQAAETGEMEQFGLPCQVRTVLCGYNDSMTTCQTCHQLNSITVEYCDRIARNSVRVGGVSGGPPRIGRTLPAARISVARGHDKAMLAAAR